MNIYCPGCGVVASSEQKFCRSCGMELKIASQSVAEHFGEIAEDSENLHKRVERLGMLIALASGGAFIFLMAATAICAAITALFGLSMEVFRFDIIFPLVSAIVFPLLLAGIGMFLYPVITKELSGHRSELSALRTAETTKKLSSETQNGAVGSITEATTTLLDTANVGNMTCNSHEEIYANPIKLSDLDSDRNNQVGREESEP